MTGCGVSGLNSAESASFSPPTLRAYSITAHCRPRQMPKNGVRRSRANRIASIIPSTLDPDPGTRRP